MMILRTLKRQPLHGYALAQDIKRTSNDLLQIEEGSLYPALQRLLKEELVKADWRISSTNRRVRIYKLTPAGAKHLEHEVSRFERMLEGITRVLAPGGPCWASVTFPRLGCSWLWPWFFGAPRPWSAFSTLFCCALLDLSKPLTN